MGTLHGGILCDIADAAMGMAFASTLAPEESFTTVELKINFFRPVWEACLKAEGKVVRRGRSLGYLECEISDERGDDDRDRQQHADHEVGRRRKAPISNSFSHCLLASFHQS